MARPKKQTVDYFPHYVIASKTLAIVQTQHGNDGYAFWFKLLEIIGRTEGHVYDYNDVGAWLYLVTNTHVSETKAREIIETFATLDMIDKELWQNNIIWVQHFVDEHIALYARRKVPLPQRPGSVQVVEERTPGKHSVTVTPITDDLKVAAMIKYYEEVAGRVLTPNDLKNLADFADNYPDGWFEKAVDEAVKNNARAPIRYIEKILESWKTEGVNPLEERTRRGRTSKDRGTDTSTEALEASTKAPMPD